MRLGILECGRSPPELQQRHGSYAAMLATLLGHPARIWPVLDGVLPDSPTECDAWLLTGSPAGVYDPLLWIPPLFDFLRAARGRAKLVGICFGHQAMAQAFGGQVVKSPKGWGVGLQEYAVTPAPWMDDAPASIRVAAMHQDQVVEKPADARLVCASEFTPFAGLDYGDAISFQFHPEFAPEFGQDLIRTRLAPLGDRAAPALHSYALGDDRAVVAGWIGRFLTG
ncbi:MAG: type 1 glutamine amidotransferase [Alphaproteobacteria bacterium]|nr:type 1 glutamine amidotransferase [Alphaproteobacteria bacterium]